MFRNIVMISLSTFVFLYFYSQLLVRPKTTQVQSTHLRESKPLRPSALVETPKTVKEKSEHPLRMVAQTKAFRESKEKKLPRQVAQKQTHKAVEKNLNLLSKKKKSALQAIAHAEYKPKKKFYRKMQKDLDDTEIRVSDADLFNVEDDSDVEVMLTP